MKNERLSPRITPARIDALADDLIDVAVKLKLGKEQRAPLTASAMVLSLLKEALLDECVWNAEAFEDAINRQVARLERQKRKARLSVVR